MGVMLECDALAILVVRLAGDAPAAGGLCWHPWHAAYDAGTNSLGVRDRPHESSPYKQLPMGERYGYFAAHIRRVLFPQSPSHSTAGPSTERWLCCPTSLSLDVGWEKERTRRARIELLERLSIPLAPASSIGLIHLALDSDGSSDPTATLKWANDLRKPFVDTGRPRFTLVDEADEQRLATRRPLKDLVERLFGDPHEEMERRLYTMILAKEPARLAARPGEQETMSSGWRRALARGSRRTEEGVEAELRDPRKAAAQSTALGHVDAVVLGRAAAFTAPAKAFDGQYARNFRSYWSESLLFALIQHERLEQLAGQLAELGFDPSTASLDRLYDEWLAFRNMLWWSQLSTTTEIPQILVELLRVENGTERLFGDLEADFATYTARRRWRLEDEQTRALANLQIYGAAAAVIGSLATIAALLHPTGGLLTVAVCLIILAGLTGALFVRRRLLPHPPSVPGGSRVHRYEQPGRTDQLDRLGTDGIGR
jgi:hypothetical protein